VRPLATPPDTTVCPPPAENVAPLTLPPGKHTLRVVYVVDLDKDPGKGRSIRAVSNAIEFEVQPPSATKRDEAPWGKPTEGFVARVRADKTVWPADQTPVFQVDIKNSGWLTGYMFKGQADCQLEIDGIAYFWLGGVEGWRIDFVPGKEYPDIPITLDKSWHPVKDRDMPSRGAPLTLAPGKHTLRVVYNVDLDRLPGKGQAIRAVSNALEFEVQPASAPKADDRSPSTSADKPVEMTRPLGDGLKVDEKGTIWDGGKPVGTWGIDGIDQPEMSSRSR